MSKTHLSPAEVMKLLRLTRKALRVYEDLGIVAPERTGAGWRVYGPHELAKLYRIKVLKNAGFSLDRIRDLLSREGDGDALSSALAMQTALLVQEQARVAAALRLVRSASARIEREERIGIDELVQLWRETDRRAEPALGERLQPYIERHLSADDHLRAQDTITNHWGKLLAEADDFRRSDEPPASARAQDLLRRWRELVELLTGGDAALAGKYGSAFEAAMNDPASTPPIDPELWAYLKRIAASAEEKHP